MKKSWSMVLDTLIIKVKHSIPDIMSVSGGTCNDGTSIAEHFTPFFRYYL